MTRSSCFQSPVSLPQLSQGLSSMTVPNDLGYFFPAEWHARQATWLTWPHNPETWPHCFEQAEQDFAGLVTAVAADEICHVIARQDRQGAIRTILEQRDATFSRIQFHDWPTNDSWIRDYGPTFLIRRQDATVAAADFSYNGWGQKYPPFDDDQRIARKILEVENVTRFEVPMTFEGGAIETNGAGRLLTTQFCALNENRNPGMTREQAERIFRDYLGVTEVWWLPGNPIEGDDTDGHIDQIARFTPSGAVVIATCENPELEDYEKAIENRQALEKYVNAATDGTTIVELPMPAPIEMEGQTLPASYTNFYITSRSVLVPQFNDPNDALACRRLEACFPQHRIVPLASHHLADGLGSFHCLTQQQPKGWQG